jgi:hypothetical protein
MLDHMPIAPPSRGDLAYLASWPLIEGIARRSAHVAHEAVIATIRSVAAARAEGRAQRRSLPKNPRMRSISR